MTSTTCTIPEDVLDNAPADGDGGVMFALTY